MKARWLLRTFVWLFVLPLSLILALLVLPTLLVSEPVPLPALTQVLNGGMTPFSVPGVMRVTELMVLLSPVCRKCCAA
jgi:hypothetical protein